MPAISSGSRHQLQFFCLEQFIGQENEVRLLDAFVDYFDLESLGFIVKGKSREGRPAFAAGTLLKLYLYGYLNRVRSSRRLEKAAQTNIELFWLLQEQKPGYKTIADFRKDNNKALKNLFGQFNRFLKGEDLLQGDQVAIDGSKFGAQNSKKNNYNERKVKRHLEYIEGQIEDYLSQLDELDELECVEPPVVYELSEKLDQLSERKQKYTKLEQQLSEARIAGETQISTSDPDAGALPKKMNIVEIGYNVQTAVESDHYLITNFEVTNKLDTYALSGMGIEAKQVLGKEQIKVLADKGYDTGVELKRCAAHQIETYVAPRQKNTSKKHRDYTKDKFIYDEEADHYTCPAGKQLKSNGNWYNKNDGIHRQSYQVKVYKLSFDQCNGCPFKMDCAGAANLKRSKGRPIERTEYEAYLEANRERVRLNKARYRKRQQIVEHPYGTIKRQWGYDYTLLKGKEKVGGEFALIFTCYNLRRAMSIFGVMDLMERLKRVFEGIWALRYSPEALIRKRIGCLSVATPRISGPAA